VGLVAYRLGRRWAWVAAATGAFLNLISLSALSPTLLPPLSSVTVEGLFAGLLLFPVALMAVRWGEQHRAREPVEPLARQSSDKEELLEHMDAAVSGSSDLRATLDAILFSTHRLVPYDLAEITLWDEERQCCVIRGWGGEDEQAYTRETGGVYYLDEGFTGWIARHHRPLLIPDVQGRQDVRPKLDTPKYPVRSYVGIPLQSRGLFVGTLELVSYQRDFAYSEQDSETLQAVGNQAAVAIENAYLYTEMRRRASELTSLAKISAAVSESLELEHVLQTITSAVLEVVGCQMSAIFVLDEAQQALRLAMTQGLSEAYAAQSQTLTLERGGRAHAVATGEPLIVPDLQADESLRAFAPISIQEGFHAFADLPLKRADRVIGMLSVAFAEPHRFSGIEIELLTAFADQAAIAIENARLYVRTDDELRRQEEALSGLRRVSREISTTLDLPPILYMVLKEAMRLGKAAAGVFVLRDAESGELRLEVCAGYSEAEEQRIRDVLKAPEAHPVLTAVLRTNQSLLVLDAAAEEREVVLTHRATPARSVLLVPVFYAGVLAGLLFLESTEEVAFDQMALEVIEGLSAQAAIAIGNAQRYREQLERRNLLHRRADQLASVLEVSRALRSDRPLEDVLEEVAYAIQESVGFNMVLISTLEGDPPYQRRMAAAGIPIADFERMREVRQPWSLMESVMDDEFRISQSYYIPGERDEVWRDRIDAYGEDADDLAREPGRWHPQDMLLVPLVGPGGDIQGLLSVDQPRDGRVPERSTVESLEIFAAQAALAIENSRMMETLQRRAEILALFNEISQSVAAKLELSEVLENVAKTAPQLLACDQSSIFLLDPQSGQYVPRAIHGSALEPISTLSFAPGEGLVGDVVQSGMPLAVDDMREESRSFLGSDADASVGSVVLAPLTVGNQVVGVLCASHRQPHESSPAEVAMLSALADQVAVAVENARLFDEVRSFSQELEQRVEERTRELADAMGELTAERDRVETLYRITSELAASLDLDHVLNRALKLTVEAVEADQASILMIELHTLAGDLQPSERLINRAAWGKEVTLPTGGAPTRFSKGEGLAGWVVEHRKAAIVPDIQQDPRWVEVDAPDERKKRQYRSALVVPLMAGGGEVQGALLLLHAQPGHFDQDHLRLVETAGVQVTNAINNAELYNLIREQAERLGSMLKTQQVEAAKSQAVLEGVADGVMVADAEGKVILFNAAAERILKLPRERALGRMTREMLGLYGGQAQDWMKTVAKWGEEPEAYAAEEYLAAQLNIEDRIVSVHLAPVLMADEFLGTVSVFRDITVEVESARAKVEFVSMVSHELRTPMTSIKGYADLLLMGAAGELADAQRSFLSVIKSNVDRLTTLVNDLLDISRMESGRMVLEVGPVRLADVTNQVITAMVTRTKEKGLDVRSEVSRDFPEIQADSDRVIQILTNLVANACQYTPTGGEIVVSARVHDDEVRVSVRDTGIGIAPDDLENIFVRFFRVDHPLVHETTGTGLGLAIVKSLVEMHGGRVEVESEVGEGSTFTFILPMRQTEPSDGSEQALTKVLLVEDDRDIAGQIQLHLTKNGQEVLIARQRDEALALAQQERLDLIALDILLPDAAGFDLLEAFKSNPRTQETPVIVIPIVPDHAALPGELRLGVVDYVTKPVDEEQLLHAVRQVLAEQDTVLVVDDDQEHLSRMRQVLRANDFGVRTTSRGRRVLRVARQVQPALVLLDYDLQDLDGQVVLKHLKSDPATRDIPVILMTECAIMDRAKRQQIFAPQTARFVNEPISIEELAEEIERVLRRAGVPFEQDHVV
jgi:PAS domain S-box-containing protein